jgi:hypothetical protein
VKYRVIPSVLDPRKYEYLKDYSLFDLIIGDCEIQGDSFGTRPKKMRISQRLFVRY